MKKGDICLADLGKSKNSFEFGKKRPVLIFQTNKLNLAVDEGIYAHYLVIPLSTKNDIVTKEFRYKITAREKLQQESYAVCNSLCFLSAASLGEKLGALSDDECREISLLIKDVLDIV